MANRIRNEKIEIKLTEEEKALFEEKRKLAKCRKQTPENPKMGAGNQRWVHLHFRSDLNRCLNSLCIPSPYGHLGLMRLKCVYV